MEDTENAEHRSAPRAGLPGLVELGVRATFAMSGLALMLLALIITADVVMRGVFNQPIELVGEAGQFILMVVLIFLGLPLVARDDANIEVDIVSAQAGRRLRMELDWIATALTCAVLLLIAWAGYYEAVRYMQLGERGIVSDIPIWWSRFAIPLGCVLAAIVLICSTIQRELEGRPLKGKPSQGSNEFTLPKEAQA